MSAPDVLPFALAAARRGWSVFPLQARAKRPARGFTNWEHHATREESTIRAHWGTRPTDNVAVACGPSGLLVLDLDMPKDGEQRPAAWAQPGITCGADVLAALAEEHADGDTSWLETFTVTTRRGGLHLYYTAGEDSTYRNTAGRLGWLIDTRATGGYVVGPGSHVADAENSGTYQVINPSTPAPVPEWISRLLRRPVPSDRPTTSTNPSPGPVPDVLNAITTNDRRRTAYVRAALTGELAKVREARPGTRNENLYIAAASLGQLAREGLLNPDWIADALRSAALEANAAGEPNPTGEIEATIRSGLNKGLREPRRTRTPTTPLGRTA